MFDTHCHLNFQAFDGQVEKVVAEAQKAGITHINIPATDVATSKKAIEVAEKFEHVYASVGIHPHHIFKFQETNSKKQTNFKFLIKDELKEIESLLGHPKVVAVGEVGVDRHYYQRTKYEEYEIDEKFISLQKEVLKKQIQLALQYKKSLIFHNREAKKDFLEVVDSLWSAQLEGRAVFHCCEPDEELLSYALAHKIFIGVDGDVTYSKEKREFVKKIPLESLVFETDSPFLLPEPYRSYPRDKKPINMPSFLSDITEFIAKLRGISKEELAKKTTANAIKLFDI
ncbi:hypothetical protein A3G67_01210 [Candidatus Roizmanbacteria bacterium RIFCSPLOWO2_12_FULL_40_12]|uniref:Hydrolase TatD n=1 Tax=Candidatus Roizmanbacteria bacterium RIFCSPLOWO2_01_FULL_40_42 TaxID=1802066 RepID=A0A1F7J512_9BACT|nr:MAG: hypothetical protein A2779_01685 [Candidatus Roizmanbacteria bacterium RIFCSPHIGHO2_01_FULL_40_98]OGK28523.1 MAG: hypothetical protein A3C31_01005 [Candidatus Roizmanbacteria bacterium RIFCSPHIGHO2_02_FULL_40_53]OGK30393.1 MAG: hypothetical protein A2W49_00740 [Candidatus Roizmanbacteria bacterium RIFCSPHIGHO2_12_41_18]OGK50711.1 MAG: hypothetical protein A3B50_04395 [Candidatus Roizmanbacteria bacterium RIFCSPLOWO2_01_FULL_40_42]OGK61566.1 MAG: hypothetical protein A3G67_01210 [Candida